MSIQFGNDKIVFPPESIIQETICGVAKRKLMGVAGMNIKIIAKAIEGWKNKSGK
jgi:hypothetical protein